MKSIMLWRKIWQFVTDQAQQVLEESMVPDLVMVPGAVQEQVLEAVAPVEEWGLAEDRLIPNLKEGV